MNRKQRSVALLLACGVLVSISIACSGDGVFTRTAANPAFNGAFAGNVAVTSSAGTVADRIKMSLSVMSPLAGDILFTTLGYVGTIVGDATGDVAAVTVTITEPCPGTLTGTMVLDDSVVGISVAIAVVGSDCNGSLEFAGELDVDDTTTIGG